MERNGSRKKFFHLANIKRFALDGSEIYNNDSFKKVDFYEFSKKNKVDIEKITLESKSDNKILKKELVDQIYTFAKNKVVLIADIHLNESYLVYIDNISHVTTNNDSEEHKKYYDYDFWYEGVNVNVFKANLLALKPHDAIVNP